MLIYWKIRYLDRTTREFGDRSLYLETTALVPVTKAAIELAVEAKTQAERRRFLRYRSLFKEDNTSQTMDEWRKTPGGDFRCVPIHEYFEDETGEELSQTELMRVLTGDPAAVYIPHGFKQHDIDLHLAEPSPVPLGDAPLPIEKLKVLAYFSRDVKELSDTAFMKDGAGTLRAVGKSPDFVGSDPVLETAVTDDEIRSHTTIFRRLYMEREPANFLKAAAIFVEGIGDHPYGKWIAGAADEYKAGLGTPPTSLPFAKNDQIKFSRKDLLDAFIYTRYAHQPNFDQQPEKTYPPDRERQYQDCLAQAAGRKGLLAWLFLTELRICSGEMVGPGRLISSWFDHHCRHHNVSVDVLSSLLDDHPGIGTKEKEADRKARVFDEKAQQLAEDLWKQAGEPAGGPGHFRKCAEDQLRKATEG